MWRPRVILKDVKCRLIMNYRRGFRSLLPTVRVAINLFNRSATQEKNFIALVQHIIVTLSVWVFFSFGVIAFAEHLTYTWTTIAAVICERHHSWNSNNCMTFQAVFYSHRFSIICIIMVQVANHIIHNSFYLWANRRVTTFSGI